MEDVNLKVTVEVQEAEAGLDKIIDKAEEAKKEIKDLNDKTQEGIPAIKNLGQSFETALGKADRNMKGLISSITGTIKGIKGFAPAFKAARVAGDSLWKSIKIGIASTGIGILVVALGEVIGNWEKWTSTIQGWLPWVKKSQEETEEFTQANEDLIKTNEEQNKLIEHQARLMKAAGAEEKDIIKYKIQETKAIQANTQAQIQETNAKIAAIKAHSAFRRWITGENKDLEKLEESLKSLEAENKKYQDGIQSLNWSLEEEEVRSQHERTESAKKGSKDRIASFKAELEYLKSYAGDVTAIMEAVAKDLDKVQPETRDWFKELLKPEHSRENSEVVLEYLEKAFADINAVTSKKYQEAIRDTQNRIKEASKQGKQDTVKALTKELEDLNKEFEGGKWKLNVTEGIFTGLLEGDAQEYANELQELISQRHLLFATGNTSLSQDLEKEKEIQLKAYEQEEQILAKRLEYIKKYLGESSAEYEDLESQMVVLGDERIAYIREQSRRIAEAVLEGRQEIIDQEEKNSQSDMKFFNLKDFNRIYDERLKALQTYYKSMMDSYDEGSEEYKKYKKLYEDITNQLNNIDKNRTQAMFQELNAQYQKWHEVYANISSVFESISDMYEEDSRAVLENAKARREAGKITEEEYKKEEERSKQQFKRAKKLQIATTVVNTIAGAIGAFLQASAAYLPPYGQILGAASAAAVTAAGIAEIQKLKNKNFDSNSVDGGGVSTPNVGVTPIEVTEDIQQSPSVLANSQSPRDQRVYILEGDIQESDRRVEIREENSTF